MNRQRLQSASGSYDWNCVLWVTNGRTIYSNYMCICSNTTRDKTHHYGIHTDVVTVDICGHGIKMFLLPDRPLPPPLLWPPLAPRQGWSLPSPPDKAHKDTRKHAHKRWFRSHDSDTVWAAVCRTPDLLYSSVLEQGPDIQAHHVTRRRLPVAGHLWITKGPLIKKLTTADTNTHWNLKHSSCGDDTGEASDHSAYYITELL